MKYRFPLVAFMILAMAAPAVARMKRAQGPLVATDPLSWVQGTVTEIADSSSFVLADGTVVRTSVETSFEGFGGFVDVAPGDFIEAGGRWQQNGVVEFMAELVIWLRGAEDAIVLFGTVDELQPGVGFTLNDGSSVVVNSGTEYENIGGLADLERGDLVKVGGGWYENVFIAQWVKRVSTGAETTAVEGQIAFLEAPDAFVLDKGTRVVVDQRTTWIGLLGYRDLRVGDVVLVEGPYDPWAGVLEADQVQRLSSGESVFVAFEGYVAQLVGSDQLVLDDGAVLELSDETVLEGFAEPSELLPGDRLWIEAYTTLDTMRYVAVKLSFINRLGTHVLFVSVIDELLSDHSFSTTDGHVVRTTATTNFIGFFALQELVPGFTVEVSGSVWTSNPLEVEAEVVKLVDGEDSTVTYEHPGGGLMSMVTGTITGLEPPAIFVIDDTYRVNVNESTVWAGEFSGFSALEEGFVVNATLAFGDELTALTVDVLGAIRVELNGVIDVIHHAAGELHLTTGEWLEYDARTVLDGDVSGLERLSTGLLVTADAVQIEASRYYALALLVEGDFDPWSVPGTEGVTSEALVVLVDGADPLAVASRYGAEIEGTLPGMLVHLFHWDPPIGVTVFLEMDQDEEIVDVGANYDFADPESIRRRFSVVDRQAQSAKYWDQNAAGAAALKSAHERTQGEGTVVAVIDTGIDPFHPLLRHRISPGGWDFIDEDPWPWEAGDGIDQDDDEDVDESLGHGTFVAGMVLLAAPGTTILPYRVLNDDGHGTTFDICRAVVMAMDRGVDVINMSFAYPQPPRVLDRVLDEASRRGIVLVSGAGNDATSVLPFPASDHRVLAVAASNADGEIAEFSNSGDTCTVSAPGDDVYSACADGEYCTWGGTSMAAPLVSGTAALLRAVNPRLSPEQIRDAIVQSALPPLEGAGEPGRLQAAGALGLVPSGDWVVSLF